VAPGTVDDDRIRTPSILLKSELANQQRESGTYSKAKAKLDILEIVDEALVVETDLDLGVRVP